jgi:hypothetical protein
VLKPLMAMAGGAKVPKVLEKEYQIPGSICQCKSCLGICLTYSSLHDNLPMTALSFEFHKIYHLVYTVEMLLNGLFVPRIVDPVFQVLWEIVYCLRSSCIFNFSSL